MEKQVMRPNLNITQMRFLLFFLTFIVIVLVALSLTGENVFFSSLYIILLPLGLVEIPFLILGKPLQEPFYLTFLLAGSPIIIPLGWLIYLFIIIFGVNAKRRFAFIGIYIFFIFLILGNIAGCANQFKLIPVID